MRSGGRAVIVKAAIRTVATPLTSLHLQLHDLAPARRREVDHILAFPRSLGRAWRGMLPLGMSEDPSSGVGCFSRTELLAIDEAGGKPLPGEVFMCRRAMMG